MSRTTTLFAGAVFAASLYANFANATTYTLVGQDIAPATATGTITTDGVLGVLSTADITAFNVTVADASGSLTMTIPNAHGYVVLGDDLTATNNNLYFDYSASDGGGLAIVVETATVLSAYCIANAPLTCLGVPNNEAIEVLGREYQGPTLQGEVLIASTAREPASWALMLAGFGGLGAAMRVRRKVVVSALGMPFRVDP